MGLLHNAGLADLYQHDIADLNPLLIALGQRGLPVDQEQRQRVAEELSAERAAVLAQMQELVPRAARHEKVWKKPRTGADERPCRVEIWVCKRCGQEKVTMKHPCIKQGGTRIRQSVESVEWVKPRPFTPSNDQLKRYAKVKGYKLLTKTDRYTGVTRETADETALRRLALRHEGDPLFPLVLRYRELDKWLGTYVGRPE